MAMKAGFVAGIWLFLTTLAGFAIEPGYISADAGKMVIENGNLFILGSRNSNVSFQSYGFWVNGVYQEMTRESVELQNLFVAGNRLYLTGRDHRWQAALWIFVRTGKEWRQERALTFGKGMMYDVKVNNLENAKVIYLSGSLDTKRCPDQPYVWIIRYDTLTKTYQPAQKKALETNQKPAYYFPRNLFVNGNTIIVAGIYENVNRRDWNSVLCIWKDFNLTKLASGPITIIDALWKNGRLYSVGYTSQQGTGIASYWIDDTVQYLRGVAIHGLAFKGSKLVLAGSDEEGRVLYWIGNRKHLLSEAKDNHFISSVLVDGEDIYFSGRLADWRPCYWKNGKLMRLYFGAQDNPDYE